MSGIQTEIDVKRNLRIHKVAGAIAVRDLIRALSEIYLDDSFSPNMNAVWDLREADFSSFTQSDISRIKGMVNRHWSGKGRSRSALITGHDETRRMTHFYEVILNLSPGKEVKRFADYSEALEWINEAPS